MTIRWQFPPASATLAHPREALMYLEKFRLDGKVAVITGAGRGIGFAAAEALSEAGALVVVTDMDGHAADAARLSG